MQYRSDIDGLRAIAVLSVIFYHLGVGLFSGGYIGVDVFFAISGYLITEIISKKMTSDTFSFSEFYFKRFKRIIPILVFTTSASFIAAYFILLPDELETFSESVIAILLMVPNIYFWSQSGGYFELNAAVNPLIHTWSLGIEEQFYLLLPLVLWCSIKYLSFNTCRKIILLFFLISLYLSSTLTSKSPEWSFYMPHIRAWELLAGSLLSLYAPKPKQSWTFLANLIALIGILMILYAACSFTDRTLFPDKNALIPVIGTLMVIWSGLIHPRALVNRFLGIKPLVFIGLISYSLYLWHWPIIVFNKMVFTEHLSIFYVIFSIGLLSIISYFFIEIPFRKKFTSSKATLLLLLSCCLLVSSVIGKLSQGIPSRLSSQTIQKIDPKQYIPDHRSCHRLSNKALLKNKYCIFGAQSKEPSFVLLGDSHAEALKHGLSEAAKTKHVSGIQLTRGGCRPLLGVYSRKNRECQKFIDISLDIISNNESIKNVFLAGYWSVPYEGFGYRNKRLDIYDAYNDRTDNQNNQDVFIKGFNRILTRLAAEGKQVFILADTPELGFNPRNIYNRKIILNQSIDSMQSNVSFGINHIIKSESQKYSKSAKYVPIDRVICPSEQCHLIRNQNLLFRDGDHISKFGSLLLQEIFEQLLDPP